MENNIDNNNDHTAFSIYKNKAIFVNESMYFDPNLVCISNAYKGLVKEIVLTSGTINDRVEKMAEEIMIKNKGKTLTFIVIMKSSFVFASELHKKIMNLMKFENTTYSHFEFVTVSSYQNDKSTGEVKINCSENFLENLKGKDILIVEDLIDTGKTLQKLKLKLENYGLNSLQFCILFYKLNKNNVDCQIFADYLGFVIPDSFVVGYGMDFNEKFRDLNHLCTISEKGFNQFLNCK